MKQPAPMPAEQLAAFERELESLCKKYRVYLTHEDSQGAGLVYYWPDDSDADERGLGLHLAGRR